MYHYICNGKHITKYSLLSLGIVLNLNNYELDDLLKKAGYKLSSAIAYDAIINYHLTHLNIKGISLLDSINDTLYSLNIPLLMTHSRT